MFRRLKNIIRRPPEQMQHVTATPRLNPQPANPQEQGGFSLPTDWELIDSVFDTTCIPGTSLEIGTVARVIEHYRQGRKEINQRRGIMGACGHLIYDINEIGGVCRFCFMEADQLLDQGLINQQQAEEHAIFCTKCASYCLHCFSKRLCARHTNLFQQPTGRIIPLCPACYEKLTMSTFDKLIRFLTGK